MSERPGIDEHDTGSYLDGSIDEFDVVSRFPDGSLQLDGAPSFRSAAHDEPLNMWNGSTLCRDHANEGAREFGYTGPVELNVSYQPGHPREAESVMVLIVDGDIVSVAAYDYGRAYFEPGEPRTAPCEVCGAETLIDTLADSAVSGGGNQP